GQQVVAMGNALGTFRNSVTSGIISGIGRPLTATDEDGEAIEQLEDMFQTDAAINPGNSGGPLVNLKGEVIGINTAIALDGQGIGFAIPINVAKVQIDSVTKNGKLSKAYLGVRYVNINAEVVDKEHLSVKAGALVLASNNQPAVVPDSPAAKAGIRSRDIITKVNTTLIVEGRGLATVLSQYPPGETLTFTILRDGKEQTVSVALGEYPL
ncbi:MAG TPA: PDZ domain-containing protein, partial [Magnetospirillaceae bacterium]|nr:PDZ domain-containing protein [Magnetospirillaceae bacterium]